MARRRPVTGSTKWCSICGLRISGEIVSPDHPLYATVDHVIPKVAGGTNSVSNRRAAHRWCNSRKGGRTKAIPQNQIVAIQSHVTSLLRRAGLKRFITDEHMRAARARVAVAIPIKADKIRHHIDNSWFIHQWETDGGACC